MAEKTTSLKSPQGYRFLWQIHPVRSNLIADLVGSMQRRLKKTIERMKKVKCEAVPVFSKLAQCFQSISVIGSARSYQQSRSLILAGEQNIVSHANPPPNLDSTC
jgi:hypothetical protein